jgi:hypothetical protein
MYMCVCMFAYFSLFLSFFLSFSLSLSPSLYARVPSTFVCVSGYIFGLLSGSTMGLGYVFIRMLGKVGVPWTNVNLIAGAVFLIGAAPAAWLAGQPMDLTAFSGSETALLLLCGFLGSTNVIVMTLGMLREKAIKTTAMRMFDIVFAFFFQATLTADPVSLLSVLGAAMVVSSVLLILFLKTDDVAPANANAATVEMVFPVELNTQVSVSAAFGLEATSPDRLSTSLTTASTVSTQSPSAAARSGSTYPQLHVQMDAAQVYGVSISDTVPTTAMNLKPDSVQLDNVITMTEQGRIVRSSFRS